MGYKDVRPVPCFEIWNHFCHALFVCMIQCDDCYKGKHFIQNGEGVGMNRTLWVVFQVE